MIDQTWAEHSFFQNLVRIERAWRYGSSFSPSYWGGDDRMRLGHRVEHIAADRLASRGAVVSLTGHKEHFDIQANGCQVEVKASRWDGRHWQWNIRDNQADVYMLACVEADRVRHWFIVPAAAIGDRTHIAVWNADPLAYAGQWARYREAWHVVDNALSQGAHPWQLPLLIQEVV